jgi:hypothetical protein
MRKLNVTILQNGTVSVSGKAGLDLAYQRLFQSAAMELEQGEPSIESAIRLIVFGCFWLEAQCNETLKDLLELSVQFEPAAMALWEHAVARTSFHAKFAIVCAFAKRRDEDHVKTLTAQMKQVFELRNRLAHFKDKDVPIADGIDVHTVGQFFENPPEAEVTKHLKPPKLQEYHKMIADGILWLNVVSEQYFPSQKTDSSKE